MASVEDTRDVRDRGWSEAQALDYSTLANKEPEWASNAAVYVWSGEEGDVGPADPRTEEQLFQRHARAGDAMKALELDVHVEGPVKIQPVQNFDDAGLHPVVLSNVKLCGYTSPTAIQGYCIPAVLQDNDVVAVAQTGSGKTAAYLIPILSKLMGKVDKIGGPRVDTSREDYDPDIHRVVAEPLVLIVCPTRELVQQIFDEARRLIYRSKLRPVCVYGGVPVKYNIQMLQKGCDVLIGTPGRLCDLMDRLHVLKLNRVKYTIIDEADEMLHQDWEEELGKIIGGGDTSVDCDHQFLMFSATFPKEARKLAREYLMQGYVRIRVGRAGSSHANVQQEILWVDSDQKQRAILDLLLATKPGLTIVFCNTIAGVEQLDDFLYNAKFPTTFIHGQRTQYEREDAMRAFRSCKSPILITTGVSARGIDIANVAYVINYDMPSAAQGGIDEYVHRIGRTGRIGHKGLATSFYSERDSELGEALVKLLMETDQVVPDFLAELKPEDGKIEFADDTDDEDEAEGSNYATAGGEAGGSAWPGADSRPVAREQETGWEKPGTGQETAVAAW